MMTIDEIRRLYDYTGWANRRLLDTARTLPEEQFTRTIASSFPSLRDTFAHIIGSEWLWFRRWRGKGRTAVPPWVATANADLLSETMNELGEERDRFLTSLTAEDVHGTIEYVNVKGETHRYPLREMLPHVANHSTYHRGQAVTMLRQLGAASAATDYLVFLNHMR
jgi:uncharacterized damage-inducible protein DinB